MTGKKRFKNSTRDGSGFVALPTMVLDSPAYFALSHTARALLLELARQYRGDNNGRMLTSLAHLGTRGWKSAGVILRAKRELIERGFIHETVMGQRPNKAAWYACTWWALDKLDGYDAGTALLFERSAYMKRDGSIAKPSQKARTAKATEARKARANLRPSDGAAATPIAPSDGVDSVPPTPSNGAIRPRSAPSLTPLDGNHLEKPSPRAHRPAVRDSAAKAVSTGGPPLAEPTVSSLNEQLQGRVVARRA
jgi:hypothetical protein